MEYILWMLFFKEEESDNYFEIDEELIFSDKDNVDGYDIDKFCIDFVISDEENKICMYLFE